MSETFGDFVMWVWFVGATLASFSLPLFVVAFGLAVYGVVKWTGLARLAATVPVVTGIGAAILMGGSGSLDPPLYIGGWYLFLVLYALTILAVRWSRVARRNEAAPQPPSD